jgi:broad specificity phosphatase PhoE
MMFTLLAATTLSVLAGGCHSDSAALARRYMSGNFASTSDYDAMGRAKFTAAIKSGIRDFDEQLQSMEREAEALGPDAREEFYGDLEQLRDQRAEFAAEFERLSSMLDEDWRDHKETVAEMYMDLREALDDTFDEVVEEGRS